RSWSTRRTTAAGSCPPSACSTTGWAGSSFSPASPTCGTRSGLRWTTRRSARSRRSSSARCVTRTTSACRSSTCSDLTGSARASAAVRRCPFCPGGGKGRKLTVRYNLCVCTACARTHWRSRMKLVIAALVVACAAVAGAEPVNLGEVRQNLFASCFPTDQEGWMVGELGRIFHTTDGGATWVRQDAGTRRPFLAMSCLDAKTAWVAGKEGIVYATKDGGTTWTQLNTGSARHVFTLEFPTAQRGH